MAAAAPAARSLAAPLAGLLRAYDEALPASGAEGLAEAAEGRGALLKKLENDATAALAGLELDHATMAVPRWVLADQETLPELDNDELKRLAAEAVLDRAVEHAKNLAAGRDIYTPGEQQEGVPADLDTLLRLPTEWIERLWEEDSPFAEVDGALVAASMAYWVGEARVTGGNLQKKVNKKAAQKLGAARVELHEARCHRRASVAPTVIVKTPLPDEAEPTYFVASCGTRKTYLRDWRCDKRTDKVDAEFGGVAAGKSHRGFWQAYSAQRDDVFAALAKQRGVEPERVVFCGHSLGGAVARLLALDWAVQQRAAAGNAEFRARLVTFGTPRGGDRVFQAAVAEMLHYKRVRTPKDPVPGWPRDYVPDAASEHWVVYPTRGDADEEKQDRDQGHAANLELEPDDNDLGLVWYCFKHPDYEYASALLRHYRSLGWEGVW